ncbi:hypothetical protein EVG20_g5308 [Dentipellis fragilis]|uniref:G-protein coupled receptors family 1 profile domain-containing protein n=1 Tax=Dentipellis fragilis TaxID=205917 RepID=A0A4Y9YVM7_9AGAM|nr:hypothetical protein EVG20_g5308 [Dentipellis fragilis]
MPSQLFGLAVKIALCETLLFGMYSVLFFVSSYILLFKRSYSKMNIIMLTAIVVMYSASATHWVISMDILLSSLRDNSTPSLVLMNQSEWLAIAYLPSINYFLSDIIVVWRAWLICERNTRLFILPLLCSAGVIVLIVVSVAFETNSARASFANSFLISMDTLIASFGLTILSNLWVTSLTAWKAWHGKYRRFIRSQFIEGTVRTNSEKVLALLVESGALYLCIWVAYLTVFLTDTKSSAIFDGAIIQLVGIYPTIIIVLVCFSMTETDASRNSNKLSTINFTAHTIGTVSSVESGASRERRQSMVVAAFYPENVSPDLRIKLDESCV